MGELSLVERLVAHRTLGRAPRQQLEWLAARGELRLVRTGEATAVEGQPITGLWVVLSGHLSIRVDRGAGPRKVMEWHGGDVTGLLPYSRLTNTPGTARAEEDSELLYVTREHFPEMVRECHELTAILVHVMVDRARHFNASDLQAEKIASLGRLAAGLAHELNNPASAVARSASTLKTYLSEAEVATKALAGVGLSDAELRAIEEVRLLCGSAAATDASSAIDRADREDAIATWLDDHGVDTALGESLADSAVTLEAFDGLAHTVTGDRLTAALRWMAAICAARRLAAEIETAAGRIHHLVAAVRGFTYLDHATAPKTVNIGQGLTDTLTVLRSKARSKSVTVTLQVDPDLPEFEGYGGELNQVWANLIDNALDAVPASGHVDVSASRQEAGIIVRVVDDGSGIPSTVQPRVFEPFFTTKAVGDGTGLGLDIARRIVRRHDGVIEFDTQPGRTEFRVILPVKGSVS
jgi:signal transduction histidine kinase